MLVLSGRTRVGTTKLVTPGTLLDQSARVEVTEKERYVSRGGLKLEAGLAAFGIAVDGLRCLDVGASTGGFTDCMLQAGAANVVAVDVGRAQLHQKLRDDARVTLLQHTNARNLPELPPVDFFAVDVSFISLRRVLPSIAARVPAGTSGILLLKPQFEAAAKEVPRGGVIRDKAIRTRLRGEFIEWATGEGWEVRDFIDCPVAGGDGNVEFLLSVVSPGAAEC